MVDANLIDALKGAVSLAQAARELFNPPRHVSALYRYADVGVRGVKLTTYWSGGIRCTTPEAVEDFLRALNVPTSTPPKPAPDANPSPRDHKSADAKFKAQAREAGRKVRELTRSRKPARV